ncbi:MAG: hypothetical protein WA006_05380, partial [Rhodoglobus sp.]
MFEYEQVSPATVISALEQPSASAEQIESLRARIRSMQATRLPSRLLPTHPAIAELLPGGGLQQGAAYSVGRSAMLLMT